MAMRATPDAPRECAAVQPMADPRANLILAALPPEEYERLRPALVVVPLRVGDALFEAAGPIADLHFPVAGLVSLVTPLQDGSAVEVATVGREGVVGVPFALGGSLGVRAVVQVAGGAARLAAVDFVPELERRGPLNLLARQYAQVTFNQVAQAAACNRLHSNEQRLSRWLLLCQDRVPGEALPVTHETLAQMLGSRRATVTQSARVLHDLGVIQYRRGRVRIVDRAGLERSACECYGIISAQLRRSEPGRA
jgi:CRP-like cAMP-binding protein